MIAHRNSKTVPVESATGTAASENAPDPCAEREIEPCSSAANVRRGFRAIITAAGIGGSWADRSPIRGPTD